MSAHHLCESPRCWHDSDTGTLEPHPAAPGLLLCWSCRDRLVRDLDRLPALCADLETALANTGSGSSGPVVSGSRERALPLNTAAAYSRAEILPVLTAWAALVVDGRGVRAPRRDPGALALWLRRHADWLAAHPAAGDAADEVAEVCHVAARGAYPRQVRRVQLGACPFSNCDGAIWAIVRDPSAVLPSAAACDARAAHEWSMAEWPRLRRAMRAAA